MVWNLGLLFLMFLVAALAVIGALVIWVVMRFLRPLPDTTPPPRNETAPPKRAEVQRLRPAAEGAPHPGDTAAACPECGAVLTGDAPEGLCPRCLLRQALMAPSPTPSEGPGPVSGHGPFTAPVPEELAPHFPQLEILALLGQGGMGAVYKARQLKLDRFVALKVLPREWGRDPAFAERFAREARALARLSHPHIVAVHDFGEAGGYFFLLMEFVDGANLRQFLQAGPLDPRLALEVVPQICDALQYAHEEGVVHRDVKPENLLLDGRGRVRIADFGLAKLVGPSRASFTLTGTHQVMGTLDYMAPEQRNRPQDVDHRADIYSLGVVFYEMLTGELPLGRFAPPSQAAGVDARLDEVIHRALEREPEQRYQHVSEVRKELASITAGASAPAETSGVGPSRLSVAEDLQLQVQGPAAALLVTALAAVIHWAVVAMVVGFSASGHDDLVSNVFLVVACVVLALAGVIAVGAANLKRFDGYGSVVAAVLVAMLPWSLHCLIGIPAGIWTLSVVDRREVRAAFAANLRRRQRPPQPPARRATAPRRGLRAFWRSFCSAFMSSPARGPSALPAEPPSTSE